MAAQVPPVNFALSPAQAIQGIIAYDTPVGAKIYKAAVDPLEDQFNCKPEGLKVFLSQISDRSLSAGWAEVLEIPPDVAHPNVNLINLLTDYGTITLDQVQAHAWSYNNDQSHAAQESVQLYHCIMSSLTKEGRAKIMLFSPLYTINNIPSGPTLLKVVIRESHIDTNTTTKFIHASLSSLDTYMTEVSSDIEKLNQHVRNQLNSLHARGETTHDLLSNLFKGYAAASDKEFKAYIARKEEKYEEGPMGTKTTPKN